MGEHAKYRPLVSLQTAQYLLKGDGMTVSRTDTLSRCVRQTRNRRMGVAICLGLTALSLGSLAEAGCRQALVLALDISGSVDQAEHSLQRRGLAAALNSDDVRAVLLKDIENPVRFSVFEWSGPGDQQTISDWLQVDSDAALDQLIQRIETAPRVAANPSTALGQAMLHGGELLTSQPCWQLTLDISGDGVSNTGPRPQDVDLDPAITVNGLVIKTTPAPIGRRIREQTDELEVYFETNVVRGDLSFIEIANGFEDYERAMRRKLLRELTSLTVGSASLSAPRLAQ
ncbi:DUF1194 domain-containing protein [Aestuariibius insulae]|uniref:DUF1194 domain-containing protein n=1 Tax=Aestuariibius insulae TaxID=2058287 RepID=UPI00345E1E99